MSEEATAITPRPSVSALLWEDLLGTKFQPHAETDVKKTRGRPRKIFNVGSKRTHKMSDAEPETRNLLSATEHKLMLDFKEYVQEGASPRDALDQVCRLYRVPYAQAFNICADSY